MDRPANHVPLRELCKSCGSKDGLYRISGLQRPVHCADCDLYANFNASRMETGEASVSSSQRQRILERDGFRCGMCGRAPNHGVTLQIDRLVARADLARYGLTKPADVNHDANLLTTCDECNLGRGSRSVAPAALMALSVVIAQRRAREKKKDGAA
jgi:5-methylcytosine-specific restriction endonuclease McrA